MIIGVIGGVAVLVVAILVVVDAVRFRRRSRTASQRLASSEARMLRLLDELPDAVLTLDADSRIESANRRAVALTGRSLDDLLGRSFLGMVSDDDQADITDRWRRIIHADGEASLVWEDRTATFELVDVLGACHLVEASVHRPSEADANDARGLVIVLRDVSDRERSVRALEAARRRFQLAFHSAPTGMALVRLKDNKILDANQSLADMLQSSRRYLVGRTMRDITHPDDLRAGSAERARVDLGIEDGYRLEQRYLRRDGEYVWAKTQVSVTEDAGVQLAITHIEDVTEQRQNAADLTHAATHDDLTSLPNRASIVSTLTNLLAHGDPGDVAVLFLDLDNFKLVNDSLGHSVGDEVLQHVARRFRSVMREGDEIGRFGGDEFVVVIDGRRRPSDLTGELRIGPLDPEKVAERLLRSVQDAVTIGAQEILVTTSIGYATNDRLGMSADDLLRNADTAMYRAKAGGRDRVAAFTDDARLASVAALQTSNELRRALERHELVPYFQPIVDIETGEVACLEVLVRWTHSDRGLLAPAQFLPIAEMSGLVGLIGERMLRDSLAQLAHWRANDDPAGRATLSVNLAAQQLTDPGFVDMVRDALGTTGIEAGALWFEITESALLSDVAAATTVLRELRGLGVHLSVDDFGTGYSSLTYLKRFPVEAIKIDQTFVAGLGIEIDDSSIVDAVVHLGDSLGLAVIAEGVETPLQLDQLRELGVGRAQGHLFGRPVPADEVGRHEALALT